jgi:hypothetical protein
MMGAGTLGAFALKLEPYRPWLLGASSALLAAAYYLTYRPAPAAAADTQGDACTTCTPASRRAARWSLWAATVVVVLLAAFPYYVRFLL